ncbi:Mss4-like protein [Fomitopsis serialis]|uniref:Mss4-like protein n=1 Tax=Fomitopsis serialis TaxID=139415 RepID=UPI002007AB9B|nr:Mss4-like protein [Neoantrodia serialis]KAH9932340.1 Mss4-like protein [Neoantrodia serialis]
MSDVEGSCHCGAIKLRVVGGFDDNATAIVCHCTVCTTLSGSLFSYVAPIPRRLQAAEVRELSGKQVTRHFCGDCGTPLWAEFESAPEEYFIKLALFGNKLPPGAEVFWKNVHESRQKPIVAPEAVFDALPA